jgi:integrase
VDTVARKNEVLRTTWDLADLDHGKLAVPRSKSGRPRYVPLSPIALLVLQRQAMPRVAYDPHVFPNRAAIDAFMQECMQDHKRYECTALWRAGGTQSWLLIPSVPIQN